MAKVCPACGLLNPPSTLRCDCGLDLREASRGAAHKIRRRELERPRRRRTLGFALIVVGLFPAVAAVAAGSSMALLGALNLPLVAGLALVVHSQLRIRDLRLTAARSELPEAKLVGDPPAADR